MSFLVELRTKQINGQMASATNVFTKAIKKFEAAIADAHKYKQKNNEEIDKLKEDIAKRELNNNTLTQNIVIMTNSSIKIQKILGE